MDIIQLLPDSVANQIAAGEVVQRPSSVIKELMENAVDAGATSIDVLVTDAGRTSIQVIDDGSGMSETDARLAFERHATSKIRKAEDLFTLHTMGFRGEALPSIAAVSQVEVKTRTADHELGTELHIEGSQVVAQEPCQCPVGTNIQVRNLFYNVPARRKFLKSNQTEMSNIMQDFERIVLVNPSVAFSLSHNGTQLLSLPSSGLRQRIVNVFGKKLNEQLLPLDVETTLAHISGFVGKPEAARKKGAHQYFFVNGRYMRHPYFHKAVTDAFTHLVPEGEQVPYFIYFQVEPANIDVNIHPTKTEIKFENDSAIWQILVAAIREALGRFNSVPSIDFDVEGRPDIPAFEQHPTRPVHAPQVEYNPDYNPFRKSSEKKAAPTDWSQLYEGISKSPSQTTVLVPDEPVEPSLFPSDELAERSAEHFQFRGQYILTTVRSGLMLVEQHRAHVRILYERYLRQMQTRSASTQGLLFPEMVQLPPSDAVILEQFADDFSMLGFDLTSLGGGSFSIQGVPSGIEGMDASRLLTQMVEEVRSEEAEPSAVRNVHHRLALTLARNTAIVVGQVLSSQEMDTLLSELFQTSNPNLTPTGKTIVSILSQEDIDRLF
ncbi:MAG: DNA mismatch repair endonuclease MutL [Bacteroidaceae bacterium]|nr:DNA mismatch repair endonuclease MutL [Bacteroidaceae bacterium]